MSKPLYWFVCMGGAILALFIPFWYAPFAVAFIFVLILKKGPPHIWLIHFIVYAFICFLYCLLVQTYGSMDLVRRIGEIFLGISPFTLALFSSLLFGIHALIGACCGNVMKGMLNVKNS